jgi:hypothetical protein
VPPAHVRTLAQARTQRGKYTKDRGKHTSHIALVARLVPAQVLCRCVLIASNRGTWPLADPLCALIGLPMWALGRTMQSLHPLPDLLSLPLQPLRSLDRSRGGVQGLFSCVPALC